MTEQDQTATDDALPIPGLELDELADPRGASTTPLELAARKSLEALAPKLDDRHALPVRLVLDLAAVVGRSSRSGKAAAAAMAAAQLRETFAGLLEDQGDEDQGDAWDDLAAELRAAELEERRRAAEAGGSP